MRALPTLGALLAVCSMTVAGCALPDADGTGQTAPPLSVDLAFAYTADGGQGYVDQTLTITNSGGAAGAPDLDIVALDAQGDPLTDVTVVTAFGSDEGEQVVPAYTEVTDILKFKGKDAAEVADVEVTVADPGTLDTDLPPANNIPVKRFDISGRTGNDTTLGSVLVKNPYDKPIRVMVVGIEFAPAADDEPMHFKQVSPLVGPLDLAPGEKVRTKVAAKYQARFFGSVRAYLVP